MSTRLAPLGPQPGARPGVVGKHLEAGSLSTGLGQAEPELTTWAYLPGS